MGHKKLTIRISSQSGMAFLVTLALVTVLSASALELARRVNSAVDSVSQEQDSIKAEQITMSGIHLAMVLLGDDANKNSIDSLQEGWADDGKLSDLVRALHPDGIEVSLFIVDELGKIQVNALLKEFPGHTFNDGQRELWERLLALVVSGDKSEDFRDPSEIINCLKDWMDSEDDDTITGVSGAEFPYYQDLDPPVYCSNAPFNRLDELFMVKGISRDLLRAKAMALLNDEAFGLEEQLQPDLDEIFTVFGMDEKKNDQGKFMFPGKININTAPAMVLSALLPAGMEDQAQELVDFRIHKPEDDAGFVNTLDKGWYEQVIELSEKEKKTFEGLIRYSSNLFKAECTAVVNTITVSLSAHIKREKNEKTGRWSCRLLRVSRI